MFLRVPPSSSRDPGAQTINAATMLGQSKTAYQAEIDAACELIDFFRFNVAFASRLAGAAALAARHAEHARAPPARGLRPRRHAVQLHRHRGQPPVPRAPDGQRRRLEAGREPGSRRVPHDAHLRGGRASRRASSTSSHGDGAPGRRRVPSITRDLAGIHFTGSTRCSSRSGAASARTSRSYNSYPRIVGETGGKDFVFAHPSAEVEALAVALVRGAYEYQGQKCSAASRAYIPRSIWPQGPRPHGRPHQGDPRWATCTDFRNFMGAVINERAFTRASTGWRHRLRRPTRRRRSSRATAGRARTAGSAAPHSSRSTTPRTRCSPRSSSGRSSRSTSTTTPSPQGVDAALDLVDRTSPYGLTGAVFARDRAGRCARGEAPPSGGRQHLHQRQADRRGRRAAAVRRCARLGHERQGGQRIQPAPLGLARASSRRRSSRRRPSVTPSCGRSEFAGADVSPFRERSLGVGQSAVAWVVAACSDDASSARLSIIAGRCGFGRSRPAVLTYRGQGCRVRRDAAGAEWIRRSRPRRCGLLGKRTRARTYRTRRRDEARRAGLCRPFSARGHDVGNAGERPRGAGTFRHESRCAR